MSTRIAAAAYIAKGWSVVPLVQGAKKADSRWSKRTYTEKHFDSGSNIAVKLGEPSDWLVDVDCDSPTAVAAAKLLLPNTGRVFGRASKPESHYLFICKDIKTAQFAHDSKMLIEIRSTGGYTMMPPSVHPSGEAVTWTLEQDPMEIAADVLHACVREIALTALIADRWSSLDHASMGHLAGFWLQGGLEPAAVLRIYKAIASIVGGGFDDEILKFARTTIAKFEDGEPVTGGPKLADYIGDDTLARMRSWLKMADDDAIDEMNRRHFWVRMGKDDVIGREDDDYVVFQRPKALVTEYANRKVVVGHDDKGKPQMKPLFQAWLEAENRRSYRKVVFAPPPVPCNADDFNLWTGYAVTPAPGDCSRFLEHLHEVICDGDADHYRYLTKLLALTLQQPGIPSQVAMVMRGEVGSGKGTLVRMLELILGRHYIQLDKVDQLVGRFNAALSAKVVVFADEAFWAGDKREVGALKRLITEPTLAIERKNIDLDPERNCVHLFMATNEEWSIPASLRERRFFAVHTSSKRLKDRPYFNAIYDEMSNGGAAAFLHDMLQVAVTADDIRNVPMTRELRVQQHQSMTPEERWWHLCLHEGEHGPIARLSAGGWGQWTPSDDIYEAYCNWLNHQKISRVLDKLEFGRRVRDLASAQKSNTYRFGGQQRQAWRLRPVTEARHYFDQRCETSTEWPDAVPVQTVTTA